MTRLCELDIMKKRSEVTGSHNLFVTLYIMLFYNLLLRGNVKIPVSMGALLKQNFSSTPEGKDVPLKILTSVNGPVLPRRVGHLSAFKVSWTPFSSLN